MGQPALFLAPNSRDAAEAGAAMAAEVIQAEVNRAGRAAVIFAAAVSQDSFLAALRECPDIPWPSVTAFHMDEYAGMPPDHPASFRRFLSERLMDRVPLAVFHEIDGEGHDPQVECERYISLLNAAAPCLAILGIGENGHLAFIDPPVCDFNDPRDMRFVELDETCRSQQVHDGAFATLAEVPRHALSLTVPRLMRVPRVLVFVNGERKSEAVKAALEGPVTELCPASALQRHPSATIFLNPQAACRLNRA